MVSAEGNLSVGWGGGVVRVCIESESMPININGVSESMRTNEPRGNYNKRNPLKRSFFSNLRNHACRVSLPVVNRQDSFLCCNQF